MPRPALRLALLAALLGIPAVARAHPGHAPTPYDWWREWSFEPGVVLPMVVVSLLYAVGVRRLWRRGGAGRAVRPWQAACFAGGMATLALALITPLDAMGNALFAAHMLQHEILILASAPLLVAGAPMLPVLWALPMPARESLGAFGSQVLQRPWRLLTHPVAASLLHAVAVLGWHVPSAYEASVTSEAVHALQHASFAGTAVLFWYSILHARDRRGRYGAAVLSLFATAGYGAALGAILAFSRQAWYDVYATTTQIWGLTPVADQQLGGLIMWIPAGLVHLPVALWFFAVWAGFAAPRGATRGPAAVLGHPAR